MIHPEWVFKDMLVMAIGYLIAVGSVIFINDQWFETVFITIGVFMMIYPIINILPTGCRSP